MAITYESVASAAVLLKNQGERPSIRGVRTLIGTGSLGTIQKHLQVWRRTQSLLPKNEVPLFPEIMELILKEVKKAGDQSQAAVIGDLAILQKELDEMVLDNEEKERETALLNQKVRTLEEKTQHQAGTIFQLENTLAQTVERESLEQQKREECLRSLAKAEVRLEEFVRTRGELKELRKDLENEKAARVKAETSAAVSEALLKKES